MKKENENLGASDWAVVIIDQIGKLETRLQPILRDEDEKDKMVVAGTTPLNAKLAMIAYKLERLLERIDI